MLTVPTQHSPLLSFASAEGLFWAHEGCEKFQGQNAPPKTKSPAIGCSRKRTHLLSKKARTILDRIGLSSRSGTLLKFSLLGSRKERHREKGEKRKQMSDSTFPGLYFLSRADTARTVHRRVWNAPRPAASSTSSPTGGAGRIWRLKDVLGNPIHVLDIHLREKKPQDTARIAPHSKVRGHLRPIADPGERRHPAILETNSRRPAWRFGKQSARSSARDMGSYRVTQQSHSQGYTQEKRKHAST